MEEVVSNTKYVNYILESCESKRTYVGCTNNPKRRIRQHNGIIKGGAKSTSVARPYKFVCIVSGFKDRTIACKYEWNLKHPDGKRKVKSKYRGIKGRLLGLSEMFYTDYFKKKDLKLPTKIYILKKYKKYLDIERLEKDFKIITV